jgi:hypothetical protein
LDGKRVCILPDNDEPGEKYAREVVELIRKQAPNATVLVKRLKEDWPAIPDGGDVFDWQEQFDTADVATLVDRLHQISDCVSDFVGDCPPKHGGNRVFADKANEFISFPLDELPPVLATFCREVSQSIGCDSSYPALTVLAVCASSIGTSRQVCLKKGWFDFWKIDGITMRSAIALAEWFKTETLRIGRVLSESESLREARHLAAWIQARGGRITASVLNDCRRDIVNNDHAELKLMQLVELKFGTWQGIHKSREFVLNQ